MSIKEDSIIGSILIVLKRRPDILALLLVVGVFLYYMDRQDMEQRLSQERREVREDLVATQRINVCHDVQVRAVEALERVAEMLQIHSESDALLTNEIETLTITVSGNTDGLMRVERTLSELILEINMHEKYNSINYDTNH